MNFQLFSSSLQLNLKMKKTLQINIELQLSPWSTEMMNEKKNSNKKKKN